MALSKNKHMSPAEIIRRGFNSKVLKDNTVFKEVIEDMYDKYTLKEDIVAASDLDYKTKAEQLVRYAYLRTLISEVMITLDGFINLAENEQFKESSQQ